MGSSSFNPHTRFLEDSIGGTAYTTQDSKLSVNDLHPTAGEMFELFQRAGVPT